MEKINASSEQELPPPPQTDGGSNARVSEQSQQAADEKAQPGGEDDEVDMSRQAISVKGDSAKTLSAFSGGGKSALPDCSDCKDEISSPVSSTPFQQ